MYRIAFFPLIILCSLFFTGLSSAAPFEKIIMPGKLTNVHKKFENDCKKCHESFSKRDQSGRCLDCHKKIATDINKKKGFHGKSKQIKNRRCKSCHTDHKGRQANIIVLDKETFNHKISDFPLKGQKIPPSPA